MLGYLFCDAIGTLPKIPAIRALLNHPSVLSSGSLLILCQESSEFQPKLTLSVRSKPLFLVLSLRGQPRPIRVSSCLDVMDPFLPMALDQGYVNGQKAIAYL